MPASVPYPGFARAEGATGRTARPMIARQPRVLQIDFMGTGYLPAAPFAATFVFMTAGVTVKSAERETVWLSVRSVA